MTGGFIIVAPEIVRNGSQPVYSRLKAHDGVPEVHARSVEDALRLPGCARKRRNHAARALAEDDDLVVVDGGRDGTAYINSTMR